MSRPPPPPTLHPTTTITTTTASSAMTETQTPPNIPPASFYGPPFGGRLPPHPGPILPPLSIPGPPQRPEIHFRSPVNNSNSLPSILNATTSFAPRPPARQPGGVAPVDRLLTSQPQSFTPPKSESFSPQQYGPPALSPRSEAEQRPRPPVDRYHYEDPRPRYADSTLTSPVDQQHAQSFGHLPSPGYTPSFSSTARDPGSHRSSAASSLGPITSYQEPAPAPPASNRRAGPSSSSVSRPPPPPIIEKSPFEYELTVRQQPIAARACGFGERDRRVIDPPPIIQLYVRDPKTGQLVQDELRYSLNVVHCTLWDAEGASEQTALIQADRRTTRRLMGQLVASPSVAKDEHDVEGCFFCFPDLSCRTHGRYKLRFVLMRIDPMNLHVGGFSPILTEVFSDVFTVYTAKDFPGMRPSSALTRALKLQGCNIQVKKGNDKSFRKRVSASVEADDDDDDADSVKGKRRRRD